MSKIIKSNKRIGYITAIIFFGYIVIVMLQSSNLISISFSFMRITSSLLCLLILIHIIMSIVVILKTKEKRSKYQIMRIISGILILVMLGLHIFFAVKLPGSIITTMCICIMFLVTLIHIIPLKILVRGGK